MDTTKPMGQMGLDARAKIRSELLEQLVPRIKAPPVQARNVAHVALDKHYDAGLTVPEWVSAVGQALNMETHGIEFGQQEPRTQPAPQPAAQSQPAAQPQPAAQHSSDPATPNGAPADEDEDEDEPPKTPPPPQPEAVARHAEAGRSHDPRHDKRRR
jgi:hypothetical protein